MMKRMSFSETIFLFFLALIIFGPKKLPEIARQVAKYMNEFKRASNEFKAQIEQEISQLEVEKKQQVLPPSPAPAYTASRTLTSTPTESPAPATLAASNDEPASAARDGGSEQVATEAVTTPAPVTPSTSQESHA